MTIKEERVALVENYKAVNRLLNDISDAVCDLPAVTDDEWDAMENLLFEIRAEWEDLLLGRSEMLAAPERKNAWFADFVRSFGEVCDRYLTEKQYRVFERYCESPHEYESRSRYCIKTFCRVENLHVTVIRSTHMSGNPWYTVTIRRIPDRPENLSEYVRK